MDGVQSLFICFLGMNQARLTNRQAGTSSDSTPPQLPKDKWKLERDISQSQHKSTGERQFFHWCLSQETNNSSFISGTQDRLLDNLKEKLFGDV